MIVPQVTRIAYACRGWPETHVCPVRIAEGIWCRDCRSRRQAALLRGVPDSYVAVETVVENIATTGDILCKCGGNAAADDHEHTLLHVEWSWKHERRNPRVQTQ